MLEAVIEVYCHNPNGASLDHIPVSSKLQSVTSEYGLAIPIKQIVYLQIFNDIHNNS